MKKIKVYMTFLAVFALLLTSCSKDDGAVGDQEELATLSFTTVLNDLVANKAAIKQQLGIPACSDDTPQYVAVVLTGETNVGTVEDPIILSVNPEPGNFDDDPEAEYFTEESTELELTPGEYSLEYFAVFNGAPGEAGTDVIWVAPREDGELARFVDTSLPFTFEIGPGAKKYVDVEVLCFDDRIVNEYGYLFFELETNRAIEFCVFGNFCDANGRHFTAAYSVSIWNFADGARGEIIHDEVTNTVTPNGDGDYAADPVCLALPDTAGADEYWIEISLLDTDQYDTQERVIRSGVLTDEEVRNLFVGEDAVDYYHFRQGNCGDEDIPELFDEEDPTGGTDGDGIPDEVDNCPETANPDQADMDNDGIGDECDPDRDGDGIDNTEDNCPDQNPETDVDGDGCEDGTGETDTDEDGIPDEEDNCPETANPDQADLDNDGIGDVCDADRDGDGIDNTEDNCPDQNPETDVDEDGCEDGTGETDTDSDGIPDEEDNCPEVANPGQADLDNDGAGDACDADIDGDGVDNEEDLCPTENPMTDVDGDGCQDEGTDTDTDGDGVPNTTDNCPETANPDQADLDNDGSGDVCDPDIDGDGVLNETDACPRVNPGTDEDNDGCEDPCMIGAPTTGCTVGYLEGATGFVEVTENAPLDLSVSGTFVGTITTTITTGGELQVASELTAQGGFLYSEVEVWVSSSSSGAEILSECIVLTEDSGVFLADFGDINASYPYFVRVKANVCPAN